MKFLARARSLALICALFSAMGSTSSASNAMPSAANLLSASTRSVTMRAVPRGVQPIDFHGATDSRVSRLTANLSGIYPVLPMGRLPAAVTLNVHQGLTPAGRQSVKGAALQRAARSADFHVIGLQKASDIEESSWLIVLGTCLLGSAAALFRKMNA